MDVLHDGGAVRLGKLNVREVPDSLDAVVGEDLGHGNGSNLGDGQNRDVNIVVLQIADKLIHDVYLDIVELRTDKLRLDIKRSGEVEAPLAEAEVVH